MTALTAGSTEQVNEKDTYFFMFVLASSDTCVHEPLLTSVEHTDAYSFWWTS